MTTTTTTTCLPVKIDSAFKSLPLSISVIFILKLAETIKHPILADKCPIIVSKN